MAGLTPSAALGSARLGLAGLGWARLGSARLGWAQLGWARLGSAGLGSAWLAKEQGNHHLGIGRRGPVDNSRVPRLAWYPTTVKLNNRHPSASAAMISLHCHRSPSPSPPIIITSPSISIASQSVHNQSHGLPSPCREKTMIIVTCVMAIGIASYRLGEGHAKQILSSWQFLKLLQVRVTRSQRRHI